MPRWPTSLASRHGGTAAAVWNGKPNPIAQRNVKTSSSCGPGAMPRSGSPCAKCRNRSPTEGVLDAAEAFVGAHRGGGIGLRGWQIGADHIDAVERGLSGNAEGVLGEAERLV